MSWPWIGAAVVVWVLAAAFTVLTAPERLPPGPVSGRAVLVTDTVEGRYGSRVIARTDLGDLLFELGEARGLLRGSGVQFTGRVTGDPGRLGAHRYRARVSIEHITIDDLASAPHIEMGRAVRDRVMERVHPLAGGRALLAGFLIGDTSGLTPAEEEAMRRAGLSHFVAVSGSNVALFLGLLVFLAGPLALGPRRRALVGLAAIPVYAAATRFEPSVMRASAMAALALGGRLVGVVFEAWQLLSLAIAALLVFDPHLTSSAGFQLSVAATAGVLVGARWPVRGGGAGRVSRALAVTMGAQASVAPLILIHFGSVPLLSPLVNVAAAPIVAASTVVGAVGAAGPGSLIDVGARLADVVLFLARGAEGWPQLGPAQFALVVVVSGVAARRPRLRPQAMVAGLAAITISVVGIGRSPPDASVVVLDVGQGDAILVHGGDGRYALVDGGPDDTGLWRRLRAYGVDDLELVVLTHAHSDHATGLAGLPGRVAIGRLWARLTPHETDASTRLLSLMEEFGVPVVEPRVGDTWQLGDLLLEVEAPLRRYASPNDQSLVLTVSGPSRVMLLAGDIEVVAQSELGHLRADVLKVPHQGAATSDPDWLRGVGADLAVVSVGPNSFGHPAEWVIDVLEASGATVLRTDLEGDVVVLLD